jgi:FkbM family methyltransferase
MSIASLINYAINSTIKARRPGSHLINRIARRVIQAYDNNDVDMRSNGEHWLQGRIAARGKVVAMDVGANQGEWVSGLLERSVDCRVICFEPVPDTFLALQKNVVDSRAELLNIALSSEPGCLQINSAIDNPYVSSVHDVNLYDAEAKTVGIQVPTSTGHAEMVGNGLSRVSIVKIDAEGHDYEVLKGFQPGLSNQLIEIVQFEYNIFTLLGRRSLREFFELLEPNYLVCRLLPSGLEACGYHFCLDDFHQSNWVAISKNILNQELARQFNVTMASGLPGMALKRRLNDDAALRDALRL